MADLPCEHRGAETRKIVCNLCGEKGTEVPVHSCALYGECLRSNPDNRAAKVKHFCLACPDRSVDGVKQETVGPATRVEVRPRQPRVAILTPSLLMGGAERWMMSLTRFLPSQGIDVVGVALAEEGPSDDGIVREFSRYCRVMGTQVLSKGVDLNATNLHRMIDLQSTQRILKNADIVLTWGLGWSLKRHLGGFSGPVVFVSHGGCHWTKEIADAAAVNPIHRTAVSQWAGRVFGDAEVEVIHNGVELDRVAPASTLETIHKQWKVKPGDILVGFVGRFSREKNLVAPALAVRELQNRGYAQYRAVYVGDGWQREELTKEIKATKAKGTIFTGRMDHVGDALTALDCMVAASPSEGFSLAITEAWLAGLPVVSTPVGAVPELQLKYGQLVHEVPVENNTEMLANQVFAATRSDLSLEIVDRARDVAWHQFTAVRMANRWAAYLKGLVGE